MAVAGIDIRRVMAGAAQAAKDYDVRSFDNPAWLYAAIRNLLYTRGKKIELTQVEYLLMKTFLENPDKALSRDTIMGLVWGSEYQGDLKVVDVNIRRLRLKIEEDAAAPRHIVTVWGYGYKWEA